MNVRSWLEIWLEGFVRVNNRVVGVCWDQLLRGNILLLGLDVLLSWWNQGVVMVLLDHLTISINLKHSNIVLNRLLLILLILPCINHPCPWLFMLPCPIIDHNMPFLVLMIILTSGIRILIIRRIILIGSVSLDSPNLSIVRVGILTVSIPPASHHLIDDCLLVQIVALVLPFPDNSIVLAVHVVVPALAVVVYLALWRLWRFVVVVVVSVRVLRWLALEVMGLLMVLSILYEIRVTLAFFRSVGVDYVLMLQLNTALLDYTVFVWQKQVIRHVICLASDLITDYSAGLIEVQLFQLLSLVQKGLIELRMFCYCIYRILHHVMLLILRELSVKIVRV